MSALKRKKSESYSDLDTSFIRDIDIENIKKIKKVIEPYKKSKDQEMKTLVKNIQKILKGKKMIDDVDENGNTVLMTIIKKCSTTDVPLLLQNLLPLSNDISLQNKRGSNIFSLMLKNYNKITSVPNLLLDVAKLTDSKIINFNGNTLLMMGIITFASHRNADLICYLIKVCDLQIIKSDGACALSLALKHLCSTNNNTDNVNGILSELIDKTDIPKMNHNVLIRSALKGLGLNSVVQIDHLCSIVRRCNIGQWIVELLFEHCFKISNNTMNVFYPNKYVKDTLNGIAPLIKLINEICSKMDQNDSKIDMDIPDNKTGLTLMNIASARGAIDVIEQLLKVGISNSSRNGIYTPLESATINNETSAIRYLLENGANPNIYKLEPCLFTSIFNIYNDMPKFGNIELIQLFLDYKADPNIKFIRECGNISNNIYNNNNAVTPIIFNVIDSSIKPIFSHVSQIRIPIILLCVMRKDWFNVIQRLVKSGLDFTETKDRWNSLRFVLLKHSLSYTNYPINIDPYTSIYPMSTNLLNLSNCKIKSNEFVQAFFSTNIDTSLQMTCNGDTIMHYIIKMIIDHQLLPSSILKLKEYGSTLASRAKNNFLQTPIDLIDKAVYDGKMDEDTANGLKRELIEE